MVANAYDVQCKDKDDEQNDPKTKTAAEDSTLDRNKSSFKRVHSVRRRRAKDISKEDNTQHNNVEEKAAVSSTNLNNHDMVDKNALTEESPKEIREVEVDKSPATKGSCPSLTHENSDKDCDQKEILKGLDDEKEVTDNKNCKATQGNEDDQKNAMDVGISNMERSKRLESLIARRRSRKLLSLQVRKTLLNKDKDDKSGQISSIIIPKHNNPFLAYNLSTPFSPGPGSAPSVLIPMRNPFDIPYDPQEEKPDLTGDSFQQEFMSVNKDVMFCRHESFSLGSCLSGKLDDDEEEMSMVHDFGFIQRASPKGHRFSRSRSEVDRAYAPMVEQESFEVFQAKPSTEYPVDHIKEVIEVYDNSTQDHAEKNNDEVQIKPIPEEGLKSSSPSSSEEDEPIYKIDKEAILKSLSSMARRNVVLEPENHDQIGDHLDYATSHFDNTLRLRTPSYSIASDLQVEVSEVSSPPLTIDENFSYQDEVASTHVKDMETNITSDLGDMWAGSSNQFGADENEVNEVNKQDSDGYGFSRTSNLEDMITLSNSAEESLNEKYCIQSSLHSPSNVERQKSCQAEATNPDEKVHETLQTSVDSIISQGDSLERLAFPIHEKKQQSEMNLDPHTLHENDSSKLNESSEPSQVATVEPSKAESINKEKIPESGIKPKEAANSGSQLLSGNETSMEMVNQTNQISSRPFSNNEEVSIENLQAVGPTASSKDKDFDNNSSSSWSTEKGLSEHQEKVIGEVPCADSNKSRSNMNHSENPALLEETTHEDSWEKPKDPKIQKNSTSSNCSIGAVKDELPKSSGNETPIDLSGLVEATDSSESYTNYDHNSKDKRHDNSHVPMLVAESTLEIINTFDGETEQPITCTKTAQGV